jgi:tetratricopeptide (TPR) repeat protein
LRALGLVTILLLELPAAAAAAAGEVGSGATGEAATMAGAEGEDLQAFDRVWDYDDPAGTEARFRALLPVAEAAGDRSTLLQLRTQVARALGLQKRYDEANRELDGVEAELGDAPAVVRVRYLLERGRVRNTSGDPGGARPVFEEAWETARAGGEDGFAVDAAHMVAIVAEPDEAIAWNERALELARRSEDPRARKWRGSLLNNLGWTYHDLGRFEDAHRLFGEALELRREQGEDGPLRIARWCVARSLRSLGRVEEALAVQRELMAEAEAANEPDGFVLEEIAECLLALDRMGEARPFFARAHAELAKDPWLPENEPDRIARLAELGGTAGAGH